MPEAAAIFDPAAVVLQICQDDSIMRNQYRIDLAILAAPIRLAHNEIGKAFPRIWQRSPEVG
jgi:hypothetical protein